MAVTVEIAGIVRTTMVGKDISWTDSVGGQKQASFILADAADGFEPTDGLAVEIKQDGTVRFEGLITERQRRLAGAASASQLTFYNVTAGSYELLLNKKTVTREYSAVAFETIVADLVSTYLGSDGITENVTAGTVQTITFNGENVAEALDILCELEADGRTWRMDIGKVLTIETLTTTAAPVVLDPDLGTLGLEPRPTITPDRNGYANTVIITGGNPDLPIVYKAVDSAEVTARIAVEGGDGIYEHTEERPELKASATVQAAAEGVLEKRKLLRERFTGITRTAGFAAGQSVTVNISAMGISSQVFFVESVRTVTDPAGTEFRHTINGITGDPDGGWQSYYRREKKKPRTVPFQIEAAPGLVRIENTPGVLVHRPPALNAEFFQGTASGAMDRAITVIGLTHDGLDMLVVGRGGAANAGGCSGGEFPGCATVCHTNRQTVFGKYRIDEATRKPAAAPITCGSWDELLAHGNFKKVMCTRPDNRKVAVIQYDAPGKFIVIDINSGTIDGSVDTNIDANAFGGEPIWVGDFVFWPEPSSGDIYVYNVSAPGSPTEHAVFATSLTGVDAIVASASGASLWACGTGGFVGLDNTTAGTLAEDTVLAAGFSGSYNSLAVSDAEDIIVAAIRNGASNVRFITIDVAGTTITVNTEANLSLTTALMDGFGMVLLDNTAMCFSAKNPTGANSLEAHVFDVADPAAVTFTETFTYTHAASANTGPAKSDESNQVLYAFGGTVDTQITYGVERYDKIVPYTLEDPLLADLGGTGHSKYTVGELLVAVDTEILGKLKGPVLDQILVGDPTQATLMKWVNADVLTSFDVADSAFRIHDDGDVTKLVAFQVSGITTATTRTLTVPDGDGTLILATGLAAGQTLIGDTASGGDLILQSTAHATTGIIQVKGTEFLVSPSTATVPGHVGTIVRVFGSNADATMSFGDNNDNFSFGVDFSDSSKFKISNSSTLGTNDCMIIDGNGNTAIGAIPAWGSSAVLVIAQKIGTPPGSSPADIYQIYAADLNGAGTAGALFRDETGAITSIGTGVATAAAATTLGVGVTTFAVTSGVMTITGDGGANTIATITGGLSGQRLTLIFVDALVTITDDGTHGADSVDLSAAFTSADDTTLTIVYDGVSWYEVARSVN